MATHFVNRRNDEEQEGYPDPSSMASSEQSTLASKISRTIPSVEQGVPDISVQETPQPYQEVSQTTYQYTPQATGQQQAVPQYASQATPQHVSQTSSQVTSQYTSPAASQYTPRVAPQHTSHGAYQYTSQTTSQQARQSDVQPIISMGNVSLIYPAQPNKPALNNVSVDVYPGEFVFLIGHSGSGKSTFIRLLNRELKATSGTVIVAGQNLTTMRNRKVPYLRRQIGCVFQDFKLLTDKTTYENVAFALECIGKPRSVIRAQVPEVLRLVGLEEKMDSFPDQLSGGERQRVSVARAMVNRPPLLICYEPSGDLDPAISLGIMRLLELINQNGTTVVMATHDRDMVDSMHRRVIALEGGQVVRDQERGGYGGYDTI